MGAKFGKVEVWTFPHQLGERASCWFSRYHWVVWLLELCRFVRQKRNQIYAIVAFVIQKDALIQVFALNVNIILCKVYFCKLFTVAALIPRVGGVVSWPRYWVKSVRIRSYSMVRIQSEYGKMRDQNNSEYGHFTLCGLLIEKMISQQQITKLSWRNRLLSNQVLTMRTKYFLINFQFTVN